MHIQSYKSHKLRTSRKDGQDGELLLQHHRVLSKALQAVQWQIINYNPAQTVPTPSPEEPEINSLSKEQIDTLLNAAVYTRMKRGELLGLRWKILILKIKNYM